MMIPVLQVLLSYWMFCSFSVCGTDSFSVKTFFWGSGGVGKGLQVGGCGTKPNPDLECLNMLHHCFLQSGGSVEWVC